jgi:hypothetical protein
MPQAIAGSSSATFPVTRCQNRTRNSSTSTRWIRTRYSTPGGKTRNITVIFGLIGLCLALEKGYTGKHVQQAHIRIARGRKDLPRLEPPPRPALITVPGVLKVPDGLEKNAMIRRWMAGVWESWADRQQWVRETTEHGLAVSRKR